MNVPFFADYPATPEDLTPQWLTKVLQANGVDAQVRSFAVARIGTGQIGQNVRISLMFDDEASTNVQRPPTLVAKFVSPDPTSRATGIALGNYEREVQFYRDLAPLLAPTDLRIARCWAAEFTAERESTVLVLDDLAPAEPGDQIKGCSVDDARIAVRQAAIFHATFWESPHLAKTPWLKDPQDAERAAQLKMLLGMFWPGFVDRYRDRLRPEAEAVGDHIVATADQWILARTGPFTLTHGDYRLDNVMFETKGTVRSSVAVDWQTPAIGIGGIDIGYFIGAGLLQDDRRTYELELVKLWHNELLNLGVRNFSIDQAWDDYRHGQFSGIIIAVVASMITERTDRGDEMFWAMAGRHFEAALETNAAELLPSR